jgi:HPt (histidine-containing phosphotransfer) domain-containing protein
MTDHNAPAPEPLDLAALNELKDMLAEALNEIIDSFLEGLDAELAAIAAATQVDAPTTRSAAHALKGSAGNLGARVLAGLASEIEKSALAGDLARCKQLLPSLATAAGDARTALTAYAAQG